MHVGVCKITLRLPENQSLKGKRRVIGSLTSRIRNKFNVSIAEVESNDSWQLATLGIACTSKIVPRQNIQPHSDPEIEYTVD